MAQGGNLSAQEKWRRNEGFQLSDMPITPVPTPRATLSLGAPLVASAMTALSAPVAGFLFVAALFSHQAVLVSAALLALIVGMLGLTAIELWRSWALWRSGAWMGLDGKRHARVERPGRYRTWLMAHLLLSVVWGAASGYLSWILYLRL
jgi:hypothetical protein